MKGWKNEAFKLSLARYPKWVWSEEVEMICNVIPTKTNSPEKGRKSAADSFAKVKCE